MRSVLKACPHKPVHNFEVLDAYPEALHASPHATRNNPYTFPYRKIFLTEVTE
jgi:hypothetical protein